MICKSCRDRDHGKCRGGTWCPCQHKVSQAQLEQTLADMGSTGHEPNGA